MHTIAAFVVYANTWEMNVREKWKWTKRVQGGAVSFQEDVGYEIKDKNYAALSNDDEFSGKLKGPSGKSILNFYIWSLHFAIYITRSFKKCLKKGKYQL